MNKTVTWGKYPYSYSFREQKGKAMSSEGRLRWVRNEGDTNTLLGLFQVPRYSYSGFGCTCMSKSDLGLSNLISLVQNRSKCL